MAFHMKALGSGNRSKTVFAYTKFPRFDEVQNIKSLLIRMGSTTNLVLTILAWICLRSSIFEHLSSRDSVCADVAFMFSLSSYGDVRIMVLQLIAVRIPLLRSANEAGIFVTTKPRTNYNDQIYAPSKNCLTTKPSTNYINEIYVHSNS
ncbi:hypothetical protein V2J09_021825 [Rumex salicifolius]